MAALGMFLGHDRAYNVQLRDHSIVRRYVVGDALPGEAVFQGDFGWYTVGGLKRWFCSDVLEFFNGIRLEFRTEDAGDGPR